MDIKDARIAYYFDFIAGTSTRGLMTSMLTTPNDEKWPSFAAKDIVSFIKTTIQAPSNLWYFWATVFFMLLFLWYFWATVWNCTEVVFYGDSSFRVWFFVKEKESVFPVLKRGKHFPFGKRVVLSLVETTFLESGFSKFTKHRKDGEIVSRKMVSMKQTRPL